MKQIIFTKYKPKEGGIYSCKVQKSYKENPHETCVYINNRWIILSEYEKRDLPLSMLDISEYVEEWAFTGDFIIN